MKPVTTWPDGSPLTQEHSEAMFEAQREKDYIHYLLRENLHPWCFAPTTTNLSFWPTCPLCHW